MLAFFDLGNEVNTIYLISAKELKLLIRPTDVEAQKIDNITLDINKMIVSVFLVIDKANQVEFFEKTFLVVNISSEVVFEMLFFTLSDVNVNILD